jgi:hypothetical protein
MSYQLEVAAQTHITDLILKAVDLVAECRSYGLLDEAARLEASIQEQDLMLYALVRAIEEVELPFARKCTTWRVWSGEGPWAGEWTTWAVGLTEEQAYDMAELIPESAPYLIEDPNGATASIYDARPTRPGMDPCDPSLDMAPCEDHNG